MTYVEQWERHANPFEEAGTEPPVRLKSFKAPLIELLRPDGYWPQPLSTEQAFELLRWMATTGASKPEYTSRLQWGRAGIHELLTGGSGLSRGLIEPIASLEDLRRRFHFAILSRAASAGQERWRSDFGIGPVGVVTVRQPTFKPFAPIPHLGWSSEQAIMEDIERLTTGSAGVQMAVDLNGVHDDCRTLHGVRIAVDAEYGFALSIRYGDTAPGAHGSSWDVLIAHSRADESFLQTFARARDVFDCLVHGHVNGCDLGDMRRDYRPDFVSDQVAALSTGAVAGRAAHEPSRPMP